jgi:hypothetical protein
MSAGTAGLAGTLQLKQFHMGFIDMWHHPKYYKELRKLRNKAAQVNAHSVSISDQVISRGDSTEAGRRSPGPGLKRQASSAKLEAASDKQQAPGNKLK